MQLKIPSSGRLGACLAAVLAACCQAQAIELFPTRKESGHGIFAAAGRQDNNSARVLQQEMMDFSDRYTMAIWQALDEYLRGENDPLKRSAAEHWKVIFSSATMEIAVERQPAASLLDMAVFVELADWAAGKYWVPEVFGSRGTPLLRAHKNMLMDLDAILARTLTPAQRSELHQLVQSYKREHPPKLAPPWNLPNGSSKPLEKILRRNHGRLQRRLMLSRKRGSSQASGKPH